MIRERLSYKQAIAYNADVIVKIPVDDLAIDYFFGEFGDLGGSSKKEKKEKKLNKGVYYPANVFVYTVKGKKATTLFTSLPVADSADLSIYLIKKYKLKREASDKGYSLLKNNDGRFRVAFTEDRLVLSYSSTKESVTDVFDSLLVEGKQLTNELYLKMLKSVDDDIVILTEEGPVCTFEFEKGFISFNGSVKNSFKGAKSYNTLAEIQTDTTRAFYLSMNGIPLLKQHTLPIGETGVSVANVMAKYASGIQVNVEGTTLQEKSVITYDYNDDFEKVEVKTITQEEVPSITMSLKSNSVNGLMSYLTDKGVLKDSMLASDIFPLYTFFTKSSDRGNIIISTNVNENEKDVATYGLPFYLYANFRNLAEYKDLVFIKPYVKEVKDIEIKSQPADNNVFTFTGKLNLSDTDKSPLKLLIK
ncbi:hypothetical protein NBRC110019_24410 [Neptunitalea chrysea]|uniref:Uncharacterized protein n=2 Tax=Neptunitalea chrysea TaxID=1647581 RepID=A0A9W6B839_9FLAO|nr:hypothetical protein NBRC110019_24410 [Neptunitalea chrysea]